LDESEDEHKYCKIFSPSLADLFFIGDEGLPLFRAQLNEHTQRVERRKPGTQEKRRTGESWFDLPRPVSSACVDFRAKRHPLQDTS
jgi:hypothetical protein